MTATVVRYKTKPDRGDENQAFVEKVFAELNANKPAGLRYATFRLADGVSFIHVATVEGENPLFALDAFKAFTQDIAPRCDEPPVSSEATVVGSYALFD